MMMQRKKIINECLMLKMKPKTSTSRGRVANNERLLEMLLVVASPPPLFSMLLLSILNGFKLLHEFLVKADMMRQVESDKEDSLTSLTL